MVDPIHDAQCKKRRQRHQHHNPSSSSSLLLLSSPSSRTKQQSLLLFLLVLLLSTANPTYGEVPTADSTTAKTKKKKISGEEKGYISKTETTALCTFISFRQWDNALSRLKTHPKEALTLIEKRDMRGSKRFMGGVLTAKQLPLHLIFGVDVPDHPAGHFTTDDHDDVTIHGMEPEQIQIAKLLLEMNPEGAKVVDHQGRLPLHLAAYSPVSPPMDLLQLLIDTHPDALHVEDEDGRLPLHCATHQPATSTPVIKAIMEAYPEALQIKDRADEDALPLHLLAWGGHAHRTGIAQSFKMLHETYPESINVVDKDGDTPLMLMIKYGRTSLDMIKYALDVGAKDGDSLLKMKDRGGNSILHLAVNTLNADMKDDLVKMILETVTSHGGGDATALALLQQTNDVGRTPLHTALDKGYSTSKFVIKMLVQGYPDALKVWDNVGYLPIHLASQFGVLDLEIMRDLIQTYPAGLLAKTKIKIERRDTGQIPLHLALRAYQPPSENKDNGDISATTGKLTVMDEVVLLLAESNPKTCSITDPNHDHQLPLHTAIEKAKSHVLIDELAQFYPKGIKEKTMSGGRTAFHLLAYESEGFDPKEAELIIQILLRYDRHGAEEPDAEGLLPLHVASMEPHWEKARKYIELMKKAHESPDPKSRHIILSRLLKAYAKGAEAKDNKGNIPLHHACRAHDVDSVEMLLDIYDKGATEENKDGMLPLHIVCGTTWHPSYDVSSSSSSSEDDDDDDDSDDYDENTRKDSPSDKILKKLLDLHPEAAHIPDSNGDLPLYLACSSLLARREINPTSFEALIKANPEATMIMSPNRDNLPLHAAIRSMHGQNSHFAEEITKLLLDAHPESAKIADLRGSLPLHMVLVYTQGNNEDHAKEGAAVLRLLYDAYPDAIKMIDGIGRMVAHAMAKIVAETAGSTDPGLLLYVSFLEDVIRAYPEALQKLDRHSRTPLHSFCLHFGDSISAYGLPFEYADVRNKELEKVILLMIRLYPDALDVVDRSGETPMNMVQYDQVRSASGEVEYGEKSKTYTYLARALRLGSDYWKRVANVEESENIDLVEQGWEERVREEL